MKRFLLLLLLVITGAVAGGAIYSRLRPAHSEVDCSVAWLAHELNLTDAQRERIAALHAQSCPQIGRLAMGCGANAAQPSSPCKQATQQLVEAVCAELTPAQRERYRQLVSPCTRDAATRP